VGVFALTAPRYAHHLAVITFTNFSRHARRVGIRGNGSSMADPRIQHALDDPLAGKACVDDSRTALADYVESFRQRDADAYTASSHLNAALHHMDSAEAMLRKLLAHTEASA
jgi:hypothetical protein